MMIEAKGIEKSFGTLKVLKGVDFSAEKSEVVSIMGASGAGKSTLVDLIPRFYDVYAAADFRNTFHPGCRLFGHRRYRRLASQQQADERVPQHENRLRLPVPSSPPGIHLDRKRHDTGIDSRKERKRSEDGSQETA